MSKLALYKSIKQTTGLEPYVTAKFLSYRQRGVVTAARAGTLPLEIERGRWRGVPSEQRLCKQCNSNSIENLPHFMLDCTYNQTERDELLLVAQQKTDIDLNMPKDLIITRVLCEQSIIKYVADFIIKSFQKSRS